VVELPSKFENDPPRDRWDISTAVHEEIVEISKSEFSDNPLMLM
jgi:hypothetical protein